MNSEKGTRVLYQALSPITSVGLDTSFAFYHSDLNQQISSESLVSGMGNPKENKAVSLASSDTWADGDGRFLVHFSTVLWRLWVGERLSHASSERGASSVWG